MNTTRNPVCLLLLALTCAAPLACMEVQARGHAWSLSEVATDWIANRADCICGLDIPCQLSNPAKVEYDVLLRATPEVKKMREQGISPDSPAGVQLRAEAVDRVRVAADKARIQAGHCSVWKHIAHKDGRVIPDLTSKVLPLL